MAFFVLWVQISSFFAQISFKTILPMKKFVHLPLIVRGKIRAVEGNLCLYPRKQNLENFENGYKIRLTSLICIYHLCVNAYRLGNEYLFYSQRLFQSLLSENRCDEVSQPSDSMLCRIGGTIGDKSCARHEIRVRDYE